MFSTVGSLAKTPLVSNKYNLIQSFEVAAQILTTSMTGHHSSGILKVTISASPKYPAVSHTEPHVYSILPALASVAVSRLMLSIRSLAAQLSLEPDWLLNHTELGRVNWKPGGRDGELIVEIDNPDDDIELTTVEDNSPTFKRAYTPVLSRVGVLDHSVYPGTRDYKPPPRTRKKPNDRVGLSNGECFGCSTVFQVYSHAFCRL